ncbi:hypothetical protein [Streptomyces sp. NPDC001787]|uniref:hypothetical protein n=1 Tax=Streptomyces sp. NPDC001787 TaxID=3154523 RepID=UPI0033254A52
MAGQWPWQLPLAGALGPGPALVALAASRRRAHDETEAGAVLGELVQRVLGCGRSIALVAVAVGVPALNARRVTDERDPVLGQLDLWELPTSAAVQREYALPLIILSASAGHRPVDGFRSPGDSGRVG